MEMFQTIQITVSNDKIQNENENGSSWTKFNNINEPSKIPDIWETHGLSSLHIHSCQVWCIFNPYKSNFGIIHCKLDMKDISSCGLS